MNIEKEVEQIVSSKIKGQNITPESELSSLGLDSLDKAEILIDIEDKFNIEFSDDEMLSVKTVKDLLDLIAKKTSK